MKKLLIGSIFVACASLSSISARAEDADNDPCKVVLCMFGMVEGQHDQQCQEAIHNYFSIVSMRHGHPDLSATAKNRLSFTQQCKSTSNDFISKIDQTFGSVIK